MNDQRLAIILLAAVGMATAFMPWIKMPLLGYVVGTDHSGWITFALFLIIFLLPFLGSRKDSLTGIKLYGVVVLSLVAAGIGVWKIIDLDGPIVSVEYGLYLVTLTGFVIPLAAFMIGKRKTSTTPGKTGDFSYDVEIGKKGAPD